MTVDWLAGLARSVGTGLWPLIASIADRPYRARSASAGTHMEVVPEMAQTILVAEIDALPASQQLVDTGRFQVFCARAGQIPFALQEIGRLRELTFRAVGEGTGRCSDIDMFDAYYLHMFVWDTQGKAIIGAYRLGLVDEILARYGKRGLYTQSLFKYGSRVLDSMNPAIELGRSFVRVEYQRTFTPLLLLWRGIARFIECSPRYAVLFGPVSISSSYAPSSRRLIVEYLSANSAEPRLAPRVKPRRPLRDIACNVPSSMQRSDLKDIDDLSRLIVQIEHDHKGVPVLLRQYLRLGGRLLGFSFDPDFSDTLDGLIMVDLRNTSPKVLARYMGETGAAAFLAYHESQAQQSRRAS